jgi:hypothetical protein
MKSFSLPCVPSSRDSTEALKLINT